MPLFWNSVTRSSGPVRFIVGAALASISAGAFAQIYECIDATGNREFAQKCAPGTLRQKEVATIEAATPSAPSAPQTSYQEQDRAFRERELARAAADNKERAAAETAAKNCGSARARLASIENARRVTGASDPQTGQARYLDDNERVAAMQKARDAVAASCK